ncbi:unnamed protein product [Urochloa humidicola]
MPGTKLVALGFIVLMSTGLANVVSVARYSCANGTEMGGVGGGEYVNGAGSGFESGTGEGESGSNGVVLEEVEEVVELANMVALVMMEGLGLVRSQVHIFKDRILVMKNLPVVVVLVVVVEKDKLEVIGI